MLALGKKLKKVRNKVSAYASAAFGQQASGDGEERASVEAEAPCGGEDLGDASAGASRGVVEAYGRLAAEVNSLGEDLGKASISGVSGDGGEVCQTIPAEVLSYPDVLIHLCMLLPPKEVSSLLCINRQTSALARGSHGVWSLKLSRLLRETGETDMHHEGLEEASAKVFRSLFAQEWRRHGKTSVTKATKICHGDNPVYWDPCRKNENSPFGYTALCRTVCWFDVEMPAVTLPPGRYKTIWRVKTTGYSHGLSVQTHIKPVETNPEHDIYRHTQECTWHTVEKPWTRDMGTVNNWFDLEGPYFELCDSLRKAYVRSRMWKHSGNWTNEIELDYVQFVSV
ncbi:hypothetical protein CYMTET_19811 [Cymbomonas tetramitiformis]|uniref:F-box domain-containing protein n=1 Tax=Cymbomonas tetramitiformis TaxID=36881 RepID=A0AAE0L4K8_9CHLO|nr:hypothetical protein CYMTET_19811 [Cymbomonas tetramitiformis]|eukprot:gene26511-32537_t